MNGWDIYIDHLFGLSHIQADKVCIIGMDGGSWTSGNHPKAFKMSPSERETLAQHFKTKAFDALLDSGMSAEGTHYPVLTVDHNTVFGEQNEAGCLCVQCTKTAIVVAHSAEPKKTSTLNKAVGVIASYLESRGM